MSRDTLNKLIDHDADDSVALLVLKKGGERYAFIWDDNIPEETEAIRRHFETMAGNPELSFSFYDVLVLRNKINHMRSA